MLSAAGIVLTLATAVLGGTVVVARALQHVDDLGALTWERS